MAHASAHTLGGSKEACGAHSSADSPVRQGVSLCEENVCHPYWTPTSEFKIKCVCVSTCVLVSLEARDIRS